jgi:SAM-dependent methyltransferase
VLRADKDRLMPSAPKQSANGAPRLLNVGCGATFHRDWINIDSAPESKEVAAVDVVDGLPFGDGSFDAVYCSHMLEHLESQQGLALLAEMRRVLRPGGTVRVAVPDLETIASEYLRLLAQVRAGRDEREYDWIMLELFDQLARDRSGGEMARYLADLDVADRDYVRARIGEQAERAWTATRHPAEPLLQRLRNSGFGWFISRLRCRLAALLVACVGGRRARQAFEKGLFRATGQVHRCMYDSFSLGRALQLAGFANARVCSADESRIAGFSKYALDIDERARVRKPDSLFMEADKPAD